MKNWAVTVLLESDSFNFSSIAEQALMETNALREKVFLVAVTGPSGEPPVRDVCLVVGKAQIKLFFYEFQALDQAGACEQAHAITGAALAELNWSHFRIIQTDIAPYDAEAETENSTNSGNVIKLPGRDSRT